MAGGHAVGGGHWRYDLEGGFGDGFGGGFDCDFGGVLGGDLCGVLEDGPGHGGIGVVGGIDGSEHDPLDLGAAAGSCSV